LNWSANIVNASATESVYIDNIFLFWWGGDRLEKTSLSSKLIWLSDLGVYSPQTLTFYNANPIDLFIGKQTSSNILQFTFMSDNFTIGAVKVFLSNGCYVQYWYQ